MNDTKYKIFSIRVERETLDRVADLAAKKGWSRNQMISHLLNKGTQAEDHDSK